MNTADIFLKLIFPGFGAVILLMFLLWIFQVRTKNAGVVDIGWALGILILAAVYAGNAPGDPFRKTVALTMAALWALRLSFLLVRRMLTEKEEDRRYQQIRNEWGGNINLKFLLFFEGQAVLALILSVPFLLACLNTSPQFLFIEGAGFAVWILGFLGEMISDEQLKHFKKDPRNKGKVCQTGFWYYSRHPNYFFEWLIWAGLFIFALGSPWGWISIICPAFMLYFLLKVTGIPATEAQALRSKGEEYRRYQETTSMFVPLPKRKKNF